MSHYPTSFIDEVRARADIVDIVGRRVTLKKTGAEFTGLCPFHNEKSPSFSVSPAKQFYHCFGCGAHGNAIDFLVEDGGMSFVDAVVSIAKEYGITIPERDAPTEDIIKKQQHQTTLLELLEQAKKAFYNNLRVHHHAVAYLKDRGLTKETVKKFAIGYAHGDLSSQLTGVPTELMLEAGLMAVNDDGEIYEKFRRRVMFPIHNEKGNVIGFAGRVLQDGASPKYMNSPESAVFSKGHELFGLYFAKQEIRRSGTALVLEGQMDVVMLHQHGDERAVAAMGTSITEQQVAKLFRMSDEIVFCFDGDKAGRAASDRAARIALSVISDGKSAKFLTLPDNHDPDSYVRMHGIEQWRDVVKQKSVLLSVKLYELLASDGDTSSPEVKTKMAKEADELLRSIRSAPIFATALKSFFEEKIGFAIKGSPRKNDGIVPAAASASAAASCDAPVPTPSKNVALPREKMQLYKNFALLCAMQASSIEFVPPKFVDQHITEISQWFMSAPSGFIEKMSAAAAIQSNDLKSIITESLKSIRDRHFILLSDEEKGREIEALKFLLVRFSERKNLSEQTQALFN